MFLKIKIIKIFLFILFGYFIFFLNYQKINLQFNQFELDISKNKTNYSPIKIQEEELQNKELDVSLNDVKKKDIYKEIIITVKKNQTFSKILDQFIESNKIKYEIINEINKIFDLRKLNIGQEISFFINNLDKVEKIQFPIDFQTNLNVKIVDEITVKIVKLDKYTEKHSKEFIIKDSLYLDGIKNKIPQDILIKIIRLFSFDLDFQRDIKANTKVSVSYDTLYVKERKELNFGEINYALISIGNNSLEYFKFITEDGYIDYYNREGKNVKKSLLKTPIDGAKLSSNFGMRKHPISGYNKMHKGIDFAAPIGTPIYAGGNGIIEYAGRNGGYGKYIRIRHNNEYKTAYAHLSSFNKRISVGVRVTQGQIIGFVGNTGKSTGPHLHYEIIFQNKQINPLKLKLPSGKVLKDNELKRFQKEYKIIYANHLNTLYE